MKRFEMVITYKDGTRKTILLPGWMDDAEADHQVELRARSGKVIEIKLGYNGRPAVTVREV